jgi:HSP20 family protein
MIYAKRLPQTKAFPSVFDEFFNAFPSTFDHAAVKTAAPVNIYEDEKGYQLELNVPGRRKEDFQLNVENQLLTIKYEKKGEESKLKTIRQEFSFPGFTRSFTLDQKINTEAIEAKYDNGLLKVYLPKKEEVKITPKQISVQ